jgi:C4-dicarboxylate transporter, DctM subunit
MDINLVIIGVVGIAMLLVLMFMGVPIAFTFVVVGFVGIWIISGWDPAVYLLGTTTYKQTANYTWTVLPLFMLMGQLAGDAGLTGDAFSACKKWMGQVKGGLALATTVAASLFAAVCGSNIAASITMTKLAWPEMKKLNYDPSLALGSILCAGSLAALIPPSIPFVVYAMIVEESIGKLFIGGILPGIVLAICIVFTVWIIVKMDPKKAPPSPSVSWREKFRSLGDVWSILLLILIVLGGIWGGVFTATEAAGIGSAGALIIGLAKRAFTWKRFKHAFRESALMGGGMFILLVAVNIFNTFLTLTGLPVMLADWVVAMDLSPMAVLIFILIIYMVLGIPLELPPILMLTLPIFTPLLVSVGIDKIWFGILTTITGNLAAITPPVGAPMFIVHGIVKNDGVTLNQIFKGSWWFCIPTVVSLAICVAFPQLTLWLPNMMIGK